MVHTVVELRLFACNCSRMFTACVTDLFCFPSSLLFFPLWLTSILFPTSAPSPLHYFFHLCPVPPTSVSSVPRVVAVSPQMRLVEDNPSSLSLVEIYKQRCAKKGIEHDNPISRYYDRLATVQARGTQASHQVFMTVI